MKRLWLFIAASWLLGGPAGADEPIVVSTQQLEKAGHVIDQIRDKVPELAGYLEEAHGYLVFPRVFRAGYAWGASYGRGFMFANQEIVSRCSQYGISLGLQLGAQTYKQVILFKTKEALDAFRDGSFEFEGRASVALGTLGAHSEPAFLPEAAIVSVTGAGLMAEATANGISYSCKPAAAEP